MRSYVRRWAALVAIFAFTGLLVGARLAAAPNASGFRHAIAAAPDGALYEVDGSGRALLFGPQGGVEVRGHASGDLPLALAADGDRLLLGTDRGLEWSDDGGRTWSRTGPPGRFPALMVEGDTALAGAWAGSLQLTQDRGRTWTALSTPGAREFQAIASSAGVWYVATLTSVLVSVDRGASWSEIPVPRVTALSAGPGGVLAGTWRGQVLALSLDRPPAPVADLNAGIWAVQDGMAATTDGLRYLSGAPECLDRRPEPVAHAEVSALVVSESSVYAGVAGHGVYRGGACGGFTPLQG